MDNGKGNRKGKGKWKGIILHTPGGYAISHAVALQLQKEIYKVDLDTEGWLELVNLMPEASPTIKISADDNTNSTKESDGEYDSEHDSDVDMPMGDDVDTQYSINLNSDVDIERHSDNEVEEDEQVEDEEEVVAEVVDEDVKEDEDTDDGKEPWKIAQGEMVCTSADDLDTLVDKQSIQLSQQGQ